MITMADFDDLKEGDCYLVEAADLLCYGHVEHIDRNNMTLSLAKPHDMNTGKAFDANVNLRMDQIISVKLVVDVKGDDKKKPTAVEQSTSSDESEAEDQCMQIDMAEVMQMNQLCNRVTFISQGDQRYHNAIKSLAGESLVALVVAPFFFGRYHKPSLMLISTANQIFAFDLLFLGKIKSDLKSILEGERPRKIVHQSPRLYDALLNQCGVRLNGVVDTLVAYCLMTNDMGEYDMFDVVGKVLKVPKSYFEHGVNEKDFGAIKARPIAHSQLMYYAKKVAFQFKLFNFIMNNLVLEKFFDVCTETASSYLEI